MPRSFEVGLWFLVSAALIGLPGVFGFNTNRRIALIFLSISLIMSCLSIGCLFVTVHTLRRRKRR